MDAGRHGEPGEGGPASKTRKDVVVELQLGKAKVLSTV